MTDTEDDYEEDYGIEADDYMTMSNHQLDNQQQFNWHMSMILQGYIYGGEEFIRNHDMDVSRETVSTPSEEQLEQFFSNIQIVEGSAATRDSYPYRHVEWDRTTTLGNLLDLDGGALRSLWDNRIQLVEVRGYESEDSGRFYRFDFDHDWVYAHPNQNDAIENAINRMDDFSIGDAWNELAQNEGFLDASNRGGMGFAPLEDLSWDGVDDLVEFRDNLMLGIGVEYENRGGQGFDDQDFENTSEEERNSIIPNFNRRSEELYNWWRFQDTGEREGTSGMESLPNESSNQNIQRRIMLLGMTPRGLPIADDSEVSTYEEATGPARIIDVEDSFQRPTETLTRGGIDVAQASIPFNRLSSTDQIRTIQRTWKNAFGFIRNENAGRYIDGERVPELNESTFQWELQRHGVGDRDWWDEVKAQGFNPKNILTKDGRSGRKKVIRRGQTEDSHLILRRILFNALWSLKEKCAQRVGGCSRTTPAQWDILGRDLESRLGGPPGVNQITHYPAGMGGEEIEKKFNVETLRWWLGKVEDRRRDDVIEGMRAIQLVEPGDEGLARPGQYRPEAEDAEPDTYEDDEETDPIVSGMGEEDINDLYIDLYREAFGEISPSMWNLTQRLDPPRGTDSDSQFEQFTEDFDDYFRNTIMDSVEWPADLEDRADFNLEDPQEWWEFIGGEDAEAIALGIGQPMDNPNYPNFRRAFELWREQERGVGAWVQVLYEDMIGDVPPPPP